MSRPAHQITTHILQHLGYDGPVTELVYRDEPGGTRSVELTTTGHQPPFEPGQKTNGWLTVLISSMPIGDWWDNDRTVEWVTELINVHPGGDDG